MSEENIRCRLRWGETEFEIEGVANKDLKEKIDYLYEAFKSALEKEPKKATEIAKKGKRGGRRPPFYKSNIQRIIDESPEWFVEKDATEVAEKLRTEYGVPGANEIQVSNALIGFFKRGLLNRREEKGKYLYSVVSLKK